MNKLRVIDLLNKIANGEEVPNKIKFIGRVYDYNLKNKEYERISASNIMYSLGEDRCLDVLLDEEVEIIEEDKKIEKIDLSEWAEITYQEDWEMLTKDFNRNCNLFVNKINKIIDYLEEKE